MESSSFQNSIPSAPPPPEVKVRTMKSDLEAMARSGGGMPTFRNVMVAGLAAAPLPVPQGSPGAPVPAPVSAPSPAASHGWIGPLAVTVVGLLALGVVGYFAYTILYSPVHPASSGTATSTTP